MRCDQHTTQEPPDTTSHSPLKFEMPDDLSHTYWTSQGKYQSLADIWSEHMPSLGYTGNRNMNIFICIRKLYHDAFDNGGVNIIACSEYRAAYERYITPTFGSAIDLQDFIDCCFNKMEAALELVFEYLQDKEMRYQHYTVWRNNIESCFCSSEQTGPDWFPVTFGSIVTLCDYIKDLVNILHYTRVVVEKKPIDIELPRHCPRCGEVLSRFRGKLTSECWCVNCGFFHADVYGKRGSTENLYHDDGYGVCTIQGANGKLQTSLARRMSRQQALEKFVKCKERYDGAIQSAKLTWWDHKARVLLTLADEHFD